MVSLRLHWTLVWLQLVALVLALVFKGGKPVCESTHGQKGICACADLPSHPAPGTRSDARCWDDQASYRSELPNFLLYLALAVGACFDLETHALNMHPLLQILCALLLSAVVPVSTFALMPMPNQFLDGFGNFATVGAIFARIVQGILYIDFAYDMNRWAFGDLAVRDLAGSLRIGTLGGYGRRKRLAKVVIVIVSFALLVGSCVACVIVVMERRRALWLAITIVLLGAMLLFVSITEWCEHGSLLCSALVISYSIWLVAEAGSALPPDPNVQELSLPLGEVSIVLVFVTLIYYGITYGVGKRVIGEHGSPDSPDFLIRCAVHAVATCTFSTILAPYESVLRFSCRSVSVILFMIIYGWTLIAPKILAERQF